MNRNTAYNPLTIEGKKTVSLELFKQLGQAPDILFVAVGDGCILSGVYKGFRDLQQLDLIPSIPKIFGVQAETSLLGTCFNLARMINLLGAPKLIEAIQSVCQKSENRYQKTSVKGYKKGDWHLNDLQISESKYQHHFGMLRNFYLLICQRANKLEKYFHNSKIEANFI